MKRVFLLLLGLLLLFFVLLTDPLLIAVMVYLCVTAKSVGTILFVGLIAMWFGFFFKEKPFSSWKPSKIKSFWNNWKQIATDEKTNGE